MNTASSRLRVVFRSNWGDKYVDRVILNGSIYLQDVTTDLAVRNLIFVSFTLTAEKKEPFQKNRG